MTNEQIYEFINKARYQKAGSGFGEVYRGAGTYPSFEGIMNKQGEFRYWVLNVICAKDYSTTPVELYGFGWVAIELRYDRIIIETANTIPCVFSYNEIEQAKEKVIELYEQLDRTSLYHRIFK